MRDAYGNVGSGSWTRRRAAHELLLEHEANGELPTSIRFLFYELVQRGELPKQWTHRATGSPAATLSGAVMYLREHGMVPWNWLIDESRQLHNPWTAPSIRDWLMEAVEQASIDPWYPKPPPIVIVESRSLAGVLRNMCSDYGVPVVSTNGQAGGFLHTVLGPAIQAKQQVLYMGDFDLAGGDIEANTQAVIERYADVRWRRIAITERQIATLQRRGQTPIPKTDNRFKPPRTYQAWETEALGQSDVQRILKQALNRRLPQDLSEVHEREARERAAALKKLKRWT